MPEFQIALATDGIVIADSGRFPVLPGELLEQVLAQWQRLASGPCSCFDVIDPALEWWRTFL